MKPRQLGSDLTTDRRSFLGLATMAGLSMAAGCPVARAAGSPVRWGKAPCRFCGVGCGLQVAVRGGRVVGAVADPDAEANGGLLCAKGYHAGIELYGADRLTTPLLRRDGELRSISWARAIAILAERIAIDPGGLGFYGSGHWTLGAGYAVQKLMNGGLSNPNIAAEAGLIEASAASALSTTYGDDGALGCYEDLDTADVVILWGYNPAEEHPVLFSRITDRRLSGDEVRVIDVGDRRTRATAFAQSFVRCRPGTQHAVLRGVLAFLLRGRGWDQAFVEQSCTFRVVSQPGSPVGREVSFEDWASRVAAYTPSIVQRESGVGPEALLELAGLFADRDTRIVSLWSDDLNRSEHAAAANTLLHAVHLFSGHVGRPGDGPLGLTSQPSRTVREVGILPGGLPGGLSLLDEGDRHEAAKLWKVPAERIPSQAGPGPLELWERFSASSEEAGAIHTLWVQGANPAQTLPNASRFFGEGPRDAGKFLVVSSAYPTPTTREADLVLPSAMWVEQNGMYSSSERRTQQWFKMVEPPGDARDDVWQIIAVARALYEREAEGLTDGDGRFLFDLFDGAPIWTWRGYAASNVDRALFEEYRRFTSRKSRDLAPYRAYVGAHGLRWPVSERPDGSYRETKRRFSDESERVVDLPTGRAGICVPQASVSAQRPDDEYPFRLETRAVLEHSGSGTLTGRIPTLRRAMPHGYLEICLQDAHRLKLIDGETVVVESRTGSVKLPVWIEGRGSPYPGTVYAPVFDERMPVAELLDEPTDGAGVWAAAVRIRRP